jgi:hypothetical protein
VVPFDQFDPPRFRTHAVADFSEMGFDSQWIAISDYEEDFDVWT